MTSSITSQTWLYALGSVLLVSLVSLAGAATLSLSRSFLKRILLFLVSFAVGSLLGGAFIHLLPEAFASDLNPLVVSGSVLAGIILFFILEKFFRWRHCHQETTADHVHPVVPMNIFGDAMHNFIDGILIGVTYAVSIPLGMATTVAVLLHEIPQEIGDFSILIHGGLTVKKALLFNFASALTAVIGVVLALMLGTSMEGVLLYFLPMTAGGFIYIAGSDLIPELHHNTDVKISILQLLALLGGIAIMFGLAIAF
ncbi:MAG: ZIP family metal transporter [Candidatus Neomarinimicrobiota bacterium]|jgi:zinc and cadmium transporter|nr:MAG: ZIP family metal transporter [Candidatus Neomarinimicrobiota bacterium]